MTNEKNTSEFFELLEIVKDHGLIGSADFTAYTVSLLEDAARLHDNKQVMNLISAERLGYVTGKLYLKGEPEDFRYASKSLFVKPADHNALEFAASVRSKTDLGTSSVEFETTLIKGENEELTKPAYLEGYQSWEMELGHCDPLTDIFVIGLYLASIAYGLNFNDKNDLRRFVESRKSLYFLNKELHPTIHNVIFEMTHIYREDRIRSIEEAFVKLKNYRDYNPENYVDLTETEGFRNQDVSERSSWILSRLKSRLFDISRRNKLLYFTDKKSFLNLSVNSVPLLLDHNNIREEDIIFWNDKIKDKMVSKRKLELNSYLDTKNNRFIAPTLNQIRLTARKNKNEYGFSTMRVIVAFLHWYNFKDNPEEMITSPLLLLPAEVVKKKGVNDRFELLVEDSEAIVNPVLSFYLKDLYDITLPDYVDLSTTSIEDLIKGIEQQIAEGGSGITLEWRKKPRLQLIHSIAKKNFNLKNKNLRNRTRGLHLKSFNYSYELEDYKPLGLQIFQARIESKNNALEYIINEDLTPDESKAVSEKLRTLYTTKEEGDINPIVWQIDTCNITVGNFNYRKMSLVRDYNHIINESIKDEIFDKLFSDTPKKTQTSQKADGPLEENFPIIASDPTQSSAVELARTGESYIIQGPPGTGKSQTITNLIADFVARDKKVLFVCEKRAALDVVYHRLKNKSLDELCCLVHDSQSDKKSFILDLKDTYEDFLKNDFNLEKINAKRDGIIEAITAELDKLAYFHKVMDSGEITPLKLYEILHATKGEKAFPTLNEIVKLPNYQEWENNVTWIEEWFEALKINGMGDVISKHPFVNLSSEIIETTNPKAKIQEVISSATSILDDFSEVLDDLDEDVASYSLLDWEERINVAQRVSGIFEKGKLEVFNPKSETAAALNSAEQKLSNLSIELKEVEEKNKNWKNKFTVIDNEAAISQWDNFQKSIFRFLNPSFYKLKKTIQENYNFSAHSISPEIENILLGLKSEYNLKDALVKEQSTLMNDFGFDDFEKGIEWIKKTQLEKNEILEEWLSGNHEDLIRTLNKLSDRYQSMMTDLRKLYGEKLDLTFNQFEILLSNSNTALGSLSAFIPFIKRLPDVSVELKDALTTQNWIKSDFEFYLAYKSLTEIYEVERKFAEMDEDGIRLSINRINSLFNKYYSSNVESIRASIRQKFLKMIKVTESTASQLTEEGKNLKKRYLNSRRILENEFGKSMRYKSIRDLASSDANDIMTALKPVWLMSPLSVSDTMPIDISLFDVVIFDEASQITVEEGVPALFRTKQTIIVGDEMQMPPTNFFNAINLQDDEDEELEEKIGVTLDADSLLNQGGRKLSSVMLGWHYRSRHESLISFSNAAFYQRSLMTIPDNTIQESDVDPIPPVLDTAAPVNIDNILKRSISYHHLENGVYDKRRNKDESAYIANVVSELLKSKCRKSIGIVAFSKEQQSEIEETLDRFASYDPEFESLLEEEYQRMDEDQYNGLFVKNLENVQGDERDIIIMSVCYGYNENGRMLMNFGPINRRGGEKRLNVIFSRAKEHMVIVTSITPNEIKNDYNEGANYFKKFLTYSRHISNGNLKEANTILDGLNLTHNDAAQSTERLISLQLKKALESKGHEVDLSIGQSYFKCDLGIRSKDEGRYHTGILIDHEEHYENSNVLEQYCQRPQILNAFGWKMITVFSKDWLEKPERVLERIDQVINNKEELAEDVEKLIKIDEVKKEPVDYYSPKEEVVEEKIEKEKESNKETEVKGELVKEDLVFTRLEYSAGNSDKYWQAANRGTQIIVQYGRIGNSPQESVKSFASPEKAEEEMQKMIGKKEAKGYKKV
ncbi:MAG: superfamily I DNA and/or RNA helicase/predicted DNA-binding WGR domain protein [Arenicella sp.]|jgi:superfamily I DNA and/or RNA helicase/predicted DNA-binding WGR domain protein